jgi:alkylation response protein AidB-like acyl-CoA dehydrogenase
VVGAQAVGIAQGAIDFATGCLREREQFGKPIGSFQGLQFMLADMAMETEAARQLVYTAAAKADRQDPTSPCSARTPSARRATWP